MFPFQVSLVVYAITQSKGSPINSIESKTGLWPSRKLINREFPTLLTHRDRTRFARAIDEGYNQFQAIPAEDSYKTDPEGAEELLDTAAQTGRYYYYYPYFRVRRISKRTYDSRPSHPFSSYANDYDRFPTVA